MQLTKPNMFGQRLFGENHSSFLCGVPDSTRPAAGSVVFVGQVDTARLYGPWRSRTPADLVELLRGYPGRWWIAGGWAIEAFTDAARPHGDIDLSIPSRTRACCADTSTVASTSGPPTWGPCVHS
jgi:hypothetical protein